MNIRKIIALCSVYVRYYCSRSLRKKVQSIIDDLFKQSSANVEEKKEFVITCGFSKSGKTTFVSRYPGNENAFTIVSDKIHDYLNERVSFLQDDYTIHGRAYWARQIMTGFIREQLIKMALSNGLFIINDSVNLKAKDRRKRLALAKQYDYTTHIIWVQCPEDVLLKRIRQADKNGTNVWHDLYQNIQSKMIEVPHPHECDIFRIYDSENNCFVFI